MTRLRWARIVLVAFLAVSIVAVIPPSRQVYADDVGAKIHERALKSTVYIAMGQISGKRARLMGHASGELIDRSQRLVLTNYHVVEPTLEDETVALYVQFPQFDKNKEVITQRSKYEEKVMRFLTNQGEKNVYRARVVTHDHKRDLGIIQLDRMPPNDAVPVRLAETSPGPGGRLHSVGNRGSSDAAFVYTPGQVRQKYKRHSFGGFEIDSVMLETTSPGGPGDSGGPMFNDRGELVGICQGGYSSGNMIAEVSYFVDISEIRSLLSDKNIRLNDQKLAPRVDLNPAIEPPPADETGERVYQRALRSTVSVIYQDKSKQLQFGTGAVVDAKKGLVLTSYSVGVHGHEAFILLPWFEDGKLVVARDRYLRRVRENQALQATVLHRDAKRGIALLQLSKVPEGILPFKLAAASPNQGAAVHCMGSAANVSQALWGYTPGKVRQVYKRKTQVEADGTRFELDCTMVETNSPINGGDRGAPLMNDRGELVALTQDIITGDKARGFSVFVDGTELKAFFKEKGIELSDQDKAMGVEGGGPIAKIDSKVDPKKDPGKEEVKGSATPADEKAADQKLAFARTLVERNKDKAIERLEEIVKMYPLTRGAREAKDILEMLKKR